MVQLMLLFSIKDDFMYLVNEWIWLLLLLISDVVCFKCSNQAINSLKKGSYLLKYGRWGKPKFCPFQLSKVCFISLY